MNLTIPVIASPGFLSIKKPIGENGTIPIIMDLEKQLFVD